VLKVEELQNFELGIKVRNKLMYRILDQSFEILEKEFKLVVQMKKRILFFDFPEGVNSVYVDGKRYTRQEFEAARNREKRRLKNGRFSQAVE
jgi:hypothetical protein